MEQFKFRAWDIHKKNFIFFTLNDLIFSKEDLGLHEEMIIEQGILLKDYKDRDIYEGDIVRNTRLCVDICGDIAVVEYSQHYQNCGFEAFPKPYNDLKDDILGFNKQWIEIIGNVHENKDLLVMVEA